MEKRRPERLTEGRRGASKQGDGTILGNYRISCRKEGARDRIRNVAQVERQVLNGHRGIHRLKALIENVAFGGYRMKNSTRRNADVLSGFDDAGGILIQVHRRRSIPKADLDAKEEEIGYQHKTP